MATFKYSTSLTFKLPKVEIDKTALKKDRIKLKAKLQKAHLQGMKMFEFQLSGWLDTAINMQWPYKGEMRDIIESGVLMKSKRLDTKHFQTKSVTTVKYTAPYASIIYYGGMIQPYGNKNAASVLIPGRPWVEAALNGTHGMPKPDLARGYSDMFRSAWNSD